MNLRHRIQPPPLDDERWTNIERAVVLAATSQVARPGLTRPRWLLAGWAAATALACGIAAVALWLAWRGPTPGRTDAPIGPAATAPLAAPIAIAAGPTGSRVDLGDAVAEVAAGSEVTVTRPGGGVLLELAAGTVDLVVAPRAGRAPLVVRAADVDVIVVGTEFSVRRDEQIHVAVREGVVRVRRGQDEVRVVAGQAWAGPVTRVAGAPMPAVTAAGPDGSDAVGRPDGAAGTTVATGPLQTRSDGVMPTLRDRVASAPDGARADGERPGATDQPGRAGRGDQATGRTGRDRNGEGAQAGAGAPVLDLATAIRRQPLAPPQPVIAGEPAAQLAAYQRALTEGKGAAAAAALYGMAVVQHRGLGRDTDALRSLDAYLRRFASGEERADVLWLRIRILCRAGFGESCREAAHSYLRAFAGDGVRARLAEEIVATTAP